MKFQFSLQTLFLLTLSAVFAILDIQLWFRFKHLGHENSFGAVAMERSRLENKLGYLSVRDPSNSYFVAIPAFEPMTFRTRMYIAKNHRVRSLVVSTNPNGAKFLHWIGWKESMVFPIDWTGNHIVTIQVSKQIDGTWNTTIKEGDNKWEVPLDPNFTDFLEPGDGWSRTFWKQDFLGLNLRLDPPAIKLLAMEATPVAELPKSFSPTQGLQVWVE